MLKLERDQNGQHWVFWMRARKQVRDSTFRSPMLSFRRGEKEIRVTKCVNASGSECFAPTFSHRRRFVPRMFCLRYISPPAIRSRTFRPRDISSPEFSIFKITDRLQNINTALFFYWFNEFFKKNWTEFSCIYW